MPWLLPVLAAAQMLGVLLADRSWLSADAARALGAGALAVGLLAIRRPRWLAAAAAVSGLAAGSLAMGVRLEQATGGRPAAAFEQTVEGTIRSATSGWGGYRIDLEDVAAVPGADPFPVRIRLYGVDSPPGYPAIERRLPGERIRARVRLRAPRGLRNPGARSRLGELRRAGIAAQGRLVHPALHVRLPQQEGLRPLATLHARRGQWSQRIAAAGPGGGLLRALALGDRSGLSPDSREAFARLGIAHLLAVSGLHLALVASLAFALARVSLGRSAVLAARWDTRLLALACSLATACAYAALCGWGVPVRRALLLLCGLGLAFVSGRPRAALPLLAAAAVVVLAADPADLFRPGAQLSFAASLALAASARRDAPEASDPSLGKRALRAALRTTASAVAVTAPLAAWHLGRAAPFALGINLIAIPWTAVVLLPAAGASLLAAAVLPEGTAANAVLAATAAAAHATVSAAQATATYLPAPGPTPRFAGPVWIVLVGLAVASLAARRTRTRVILAVASTVVITLAPPAEVRPRPPRLIALEVGQGDATLVETPGAAVLIDAGTALPDGGDRGERVVLPALAALGIRALDLVVVTHADLDHRGGVPAVLRAVPVAELWLPHGAAGESGFDAIRDAARSHGVPVRERGADSPAGEFGDLRVTPLWPPRAHGGSRNDRSLVVRIDVSGRRLLLPGDIEAGAESALIERGADLAADVLALPHHGSRTSSSAAFLDAVAPQIVIASAPCEGRFGMPHVPVLERVRARSLTLWWTGRDGAVMIGLAGPITATGSADPHAEVSAACERPVARAAFRYDGPG